MILGIKNPPAFFAEGHCRYGLLCEEEVYGVCAVSSCFAVDIEACDFVGSVCAEVFGGMECDIACKALLQGFALIARRSGYRIPPGSIVRGEGAVQCQPHALPDTDAVGFYRFDVEFIIIGGFRLCFFRCLHRRRWLRFRFLRCRFRWLAWLRFRWCRRLRLCSRRFLLLLRLGGFRRLLRFRLYGWLGLLWSRFRLRFFFFCRLLWFGCRGFCGWLRFFRRSRFGRDDIARINARCIICRDRTVGNGFCRLFWLFSASGKP